MGTNPEVESMIGQSVCGVIVTYHPTPKMLENVPEILAQVQGLIVVDNGSTSDELEPVRVMSQSFGFQLIENGENLGIAEALNQGVRWARNGGYPWVILFDQDSRITEGFLCQMFADWRSHPDRERVGSIHPKYVDPDTGTEPVVRRARDGGPVLSLTSGALMPTWIFDKIGEFASEYFIDCVDFEYCLRISREAVLMHAAGRAKEKLSFLGFSFRPTHHSVVRRYYMSRNRIALYRKYFRVFPGWILQFMNDSLRETIKCFVGEQDRAGKFRSFLLGSWDGLSGRMGRRDMGSEPR
jgi:rhamnosyltransferase